MKLWLLVLVLVMLGWTLFARADLIITEVMSSSSHTNSAANGDWWELYNSGDAAVDLTGYSWDDNTATAGSADFNGLTLAAGQVLIISQETLGAEQAWLDLWSLTGVTVLNLGNTEFQNFGATGDELHLYDPSSTQIAAVSLGSATAGVSFEWDATGTSLGLSVLGENGAFQAADAAGGGPDVASPGLVSLVPEPASLFLLILGGLALARPCSRSNRRERIIQGDS